MPKTMPTLAQNLAFCAYLVPKHEPNAQPVHLAKPLPRKGFAEWGSRGSNSAKANYESALKPVPAVRLKPVMPKACLTGVFIVFICSQPRKEQQPTENLKPHECAMG